MSTEASTQMDQPGAPAPAAPRVAEGREVQDYLSGELADVRRALEKEQLEHKVTLGLVGQLRDDARLWAQRAHAAEAKLEAPAEHTLRVQAQDAGEAWAAVKAVPELKDATSLAGVVQHLVRELARAKRDHDGACSTIALMHEAATGRKGDGPRLGVVEDVQFLRLQRDEARSRLHLLVDVAHELKAERDAARGRAGVLHAEANAVQAALCEVHRSLDIADKGRAQVIRERDVMTQTLSEMAVALGVYPRTGDRLVNAALALGKAKDTAYSERNQVVALLARIAHELGWGAGVGLHPAEDAAWEADWRTILFIDLPTGQVSWHFHDSECHLLEGLPPYPAAWDGHSTPEKYERVARLRRGERPAPAEPALEPSPMAKVADALRAKAEGEQSEQAKVNPANYPPPAPAAPATSKRPLCGLCGQERLGWSVAVHEGKVLHLCQDAQRDCFHRWTELGERPGTATALGRVGVERGAGAAG